MSGRYDFEGLSHYLLARADEIVVTLVPGCKPRGRERVAGSIHGGDGDSFAFNTETGVWADFATNERGGDFISLYAAQANCTQGEAYKYLSETFGFDSINKTSLAPTKPTKELKAPEQPSEIPPAGCAMPDLIHYRYGKPQDTYRYTDKDGRLIHLVCRYEEGGKKYFTPYSYQGGKWVPKAFNLTRPIYQLENVHKKEALPVLIVEGEKTCHAAQKLVNGNYVCTTWSGGAMAWKKADFTPLQGRKVLIWPDADDPGIKVGYALAKHLLPIASEVKFLDVSDCIKTYGEGWDAADFKGTYKDFLAFGRARVKTILPEVLDPEPLPEAEGGQEPEPPPTDEQVSAIETLGLDRNRYGNPYVSELNVYRIITGMPKFAYGIWFDTFHQKIITNMGCEEGKFRNFTDSDARSILLFLQQNFGMHTISLEKVYAAIYSFADTHQKNEPKDWMESLKWDGVERLDSFFATYMGSEFSEHTMFAGRGFWISLAARIYKPGCKVDNMIVLVGPQGALKSSALGAIGKDWFAEVHQSVTSNDFKLAIQGKLIIEISELGSFSAAEDAPIKAMISCQVDRFRAPYGRSMQDYPRQCVFAGTTNDDQFQRDQTGGRRFWSIKVGKIDLEAIKRDRDQLFAEAVSKYKRGEPWHVMPKAAQDQNYEEHYRADSWEEVILDWCEMRVKVAIKDVLVDCLKFTLDRIDARAEKRVAKVLRRNGYKTKALREGNKVVRSWVKDVV